jgi:AraC-like DNA-binding protein
MNYEKPSMAKSESVYSSDTLSVSLIVAEYTSSYTEHNFNTLPAISFPLVSCFDYQAGAAKFLLDTNQILFEKEQTEFKVSKYSLLGKDVTLCFQFPQPNEELHGFFSMNKQQVTTKKRPLEINILLRRFLSVTHSPDEISKERLLNGIFNSIASNYLNENIKERSNVFQIKQIDQSKDFIHSSYDKNIRLADIASAACLSPFHFSRLFRRLTGYSPYDYLMLTRIEEAKSLLEKDTSVTQTAFSCGFNSLDNFSYAFSRIVRCSPVLYKKSKISKHGYAAPGYL